MPIMRHRRDMYRDLRDEDWTRVQAFIVAFGFAFGLLGHLAGWREHGNGDT
jgi:hypothetical protein